MKRIALVLGLGIGYVLGTKAGRQRYEQLRRWWSSFKGSEPGQQISAELHDAASRAGKVIEDKASAGVSKVSELTHRDKNATPGY